MIAGERAPIVISHAVIYMATVGVGQAVSLLLLPIITRYLTPAQYGEYTLVLATTALVGTFGSAWVRNIAMRLHLEYARAGRSRALFQTAAIAQVVPMSGLLLLGYWWTIGLGESISPATYAAGALSLLASDLYALVINTVRAEQRAVHFGAAEIASGVLRLGGTWAGLAAGLRSPAMLFVLTTAAVLAAVLVAVPALRACLTGPGGFDRAAGRELARLGLPSIPLWVGSWVMTLSNRTLLAWFLDLDAVGVYSVAQGVAERAVTALATGLYLAAWPAVLQAWTSDRATAPRVIARFLAVYVLVSLGPAVAIMVHSELILGWLVGPAYQSAAEVMPVVVAGAWLIGLAGYLNRPLELHKAYGVLSSMTLAAAGISVLLSVWLIPAHGPLGAAFGTAGGGFSMLVLSAIAGARAQPLPIPWPTLVAAAAAAALATLASWSAGSSPWGLAAFAAVYALSILAIWTWRHDEA